MAVKLKPLSQQTIVITGASSGIGLATARRAARAGANVVLAARNDEALAEVIAGIEAEGGTAVHCVADIADADAAERIAETAMAHFGGFDTWVNNAAAALYGRLIETAIEDHQRIFEVGYFGTVRASLLAVRHLSTKGGALINVGSVLSDRSVPIQGAYSAMKHAVKGFTEALRVETEMDGGHVSVTLIKPHGINTPYPEHARNLMGQPARIPPVVYDPELVAKAICFAAANPRDQLTVGGQGMLLSTMGMMFPRAADMLMENRLAEKAQQSDTPPEPGATDNLYAPREDGRERSNQDIYVRKTSLALEAQMHPLTTAAIAMGSAAALAAISMGGKALNRRDRKSRFEQSPPRERSGFPQLDRAGDRNDDDRGRGAGFDRDDRSYRAMAETVDRTHEDRLDPEDYRAELDAGIADENAVPPKDWVPTA